MIISRKQRQRPWHYARFVADGDTVVEGQAQRLVGLSVAFATIEQVPLDVIADGEQGATSTVGHSVDTIGTKYTLDQRG